MTDEQTKECKYTSLTYVDNFHYINGHTLEVDEQTKECKYTSLTYVDNKHHTTGDRVDQGRLDHSHRYPRLYERTHASRGGRPKLSRPADACARVP